MSALDDAKKSGETAGQLFGMALGALVVDLVSPEILHSLVDLAVAMRDHEQTMRDHEQTKRAKANDRLDKVVSLGLDRPHDHDPRPDSDPCWCGWPSNSTP